MLSDGLLVESKLPVSVGGNVDRGGIETGAQEVSGGDLEPSGSEINTKFY